jgi:GH15 family glucan-1,4-alpha-glucosidase
MYHYGLVGNCQISALIHQNASVDWLCLPRPDSAPVFGHLLDPEGGSFRIGPEASQIKTCHQRYLPNTNILTTEIETTAGDVFRVTDFCPRFEQHGRIYRPMALFRIVEPIHGSPQIKVICRPVSGWDKNPVKAERGNSHLRLDIRNDCLRLATNMPLTYLCEETAFSLNEKLYFALTWGVGVEDDLALVAERFLKQTRDYWRTWVKHCSIPSLFQGETIRSALALKLHCYEDTGAILAALTTSLPEEPGNGRNWDYRYCWLRDAYFALSAFHSLGHFEEMEGFLKFLLNLAHHHEASKDRLAPVYSLSCGLPVPEVLYDNWRGFNSHGPVRSNNQAAEHIQNDVYGEMVLTLSPIFFDERFYHLRTREHEELLQNLALLCARMTSVPDAGLWEVRNGWQEHTFANLMSWAGLERIGRIQGYGYLKGLSLDVAAARLKAETAIEQAVRDGSLRNGPKDESYDSALSLLSILRYPRAGLSKATLEQIIKALNVDPQKPGFFYRYLRRDDFGHPKSAFVVCSFWIAQALALLGQKNEAVAILRQTLSAANALGLYSEHFLPEKNLQLGNFPQAYSHVGLINAAFAVSPSWSEIL